MTTDTPSPSEFMRKLRPENYSDTTERTAFVIEGPVLDHYLDTITSRNQTQDFEIFCRKLCERAICPNLRPQTGPDGGGDSKADSETVPIADELATLTYVGDANAGSEKWAFAFSAMKRWAVKARKDVEGIAGTKRGYKRVFFVTNQYAKSKTRAKLEQDLAAEFGIEVTILDRAWIMKEVLENDRGDLAFNYLHVGQEVTSTSRLGPADYSKTLQLEELEKGLSDPSRFTGMRLQEVTEALLAAKYSRSTVCGPRQVREPRFSSFPEPEPMTSRTRVSFRAWSQLLLMAQCGPWNSQGHVSLLHLDIPGEQSGIHAMPSPVASSELAASILDALADRLERALDLVSSVTAIDDLDEISSLCIDAAALARSGKPERTPKSST